jgi:hypothetical protein
MSSAIYPLAKESFLSQNPSIDMDTDTIKISFGRTGSYTYSAAHQFKSSVTTVVDGDAALSSKTVALGVFDAADQLFTAVSAGAAFDFAVVWKDTGTGSTSPVICYIDGFSVTPNGGNITAQFDSGSNRIFKL